MADRSRTVLVAVPDEGLRRLARLTLAGGTYRVVEAADGESALMEIARHLPDVVVVDRDLPGPDALAICYSLKAQPETRRIAVILMHERSAPVDAQRAEQAGVAAQVGRPFTPYALLRHVEALTAGDQESGAPTAGAEDG